MATRSSVLLGLLLLGVSCTKISFRTNLEHCTYNGGDEYCAENFPDKPLCNSGEGECSIGDRVGCVAEVSPACHAPCGDPDDQTCLGGTSSGSGSSGSSSGSATETSSGSSGGMTSTTGEMPCMGDEDCTDPAAPFCDPMGACVSCGELLAGNDACADKDPTLPVCDGTQCVVCTAELADACGGSTPVCGEDNQCHACVEHSECPDSACHLDGPDVGACFDPSEVVEAFTEVELRDAVNPPGSNQVVVRLTSTFYSLTALLDIQDDEVAILGAGATIARNGDPVVAVSGSAIAYLSGVLVSNGTGDGLTCSGTSVWLDDSVVRGNEQVGMDISSGCAAHLRRSLVRINDGGGIVASGASDLFIATSAISGNGAGVGRGIALNDSSIEMTYSTVVRNDGLSDDTIQCSGTTSGTIRNSILTGRDSPSIGPCAMITFSGNAVDTDLGGTNQNVDIAEEADWFEGFFTGDLRLSAAGIEALAGIAMWEKGDPLLDFQDDPVPTDVPSHPGWDQP